MSRDNPQYQAPGFTFLGRSSADEYLEVARIHNREAKQLFDRAQEALAEDRQEEARLLTDLAIARRERADEFERAAREEGGDPIVAEILDNEEAMCKNYIPYTPTYIAPEEELPQSWKDELKPRPLGPVARAVAWIGSWIAE
jgi:acyl-CoA reductase-like NAD-dependent aldehyde dehydrogenase